MVATNEQGVIGNSQMLATIGKNGELRHLFWPTIDYPQHILGSLPGIFYSTKSAQKFEWLTDSAWETKQKYVEDTNILLTDFKNSETELNIAAKDFVLPDDNLLVREFLFENLNENDVFLRFFYYNDLALSETDIDDAAYYSPKQDAIIHYKRNFYFIYSGSQQSSGHQCGVHDEESDAFKDVYDSELSGGSLVLYDGIRAVNSCLSWDIGTLQQNQQKKLSVLIAMESNEEKVLKVLAKNKQVENNAKFEETKKYWRSWISGFKHNFRDETQNRMVKRSLLTLKLLSDKNHGGIIAAPCMSPEYRFCWPRDATYVAYAFDMCGFHEESEQFYKWCKRAQEPEGGLYQRYFIEAKIRGPTWSSQIDEIATVIWGIGKHFDLTNDEKFLKSLWPMIKKAANFMTNLLDPKTILITSVGLWEEKFGTHVYSNATVYNALKTASVIAKDLEKSSLSKKWRRAAEKIQNSLIALAWDSSKGHFIKTVNPRDESLDISVIGLSFPFEVLQAQDSMMEKTAVAIEKIFDYKVGGIGRYPQDTYYGGNPWILSTLWLGLYYKNVEDVDKLEKIVNWTINHATELDLLSEQVNKIDGSSISAVPLAWSHAFFILAVLGLAELKSVKE